MNIVATVVIAAVSSVGTVAADVPTFKAFPAKRAAIAKPAAVRLTTPETKRFQAVLRQGAREGPNFAGHYTIVRWGCGTTCNYVAIVDAKNGRVVFPPQLQPLSFVMVTDESPPLQYRIDSNLLIATGASMDRDQAGTFYYRWNGRSLKQLKYVPREW